jgi:hypothetical protein
VRSLENRRRGRFSRRRLRAKKTRADPRGRRASESSDVFPSPSAMWDCARAFADVGELLFYFLHRETTDCLFASQCRLKTFFLPFRLNPQSIPSLRKRLGRVPPPPRNTPRLVHPPPASPRPTGRARRTQSRLPRRLNPRTRQSSSIAASTASQTRRE